MFGSMVSWFMDSQMQVLAESHTAETIGPPALRPLTDHHIEKGGLIVQIWDGQGSLLTSSYPALAVPLQAADGFEEVKIGSQRWRVYSVHTPGRTVQSDSERWSSALTSSTSRRCRRDCRSRC